MRPHHDQQPSAARDGASAASTGANTAAAMDVDDCAGSPPSARDTRVLASSAGRTLARPSRSPSPSDSDDGWVRSRWRARSRSRSVRGGRGPPSVLDGEEAHGYSAGGDDSDEVVILGESTTRSESPYDPAIHTMEEVEMPNSSPVHGEPALSGGVGVGAGAPPDDGEGMELDPMTDMAGVGDGALAGVVGLGSGQVSVREAGAGVGLSAVHAASALQGAHLAELWDGEMSTVTNSRHRDANRQNRLRAERRKAARLLSHPANTPSPSTP